MERVSFSRLLRSTGIDDIRVTRATTGQLVASENAEGPTPAPGPLNFRITDGRALFTEADSIVRSAAARDLDGNGYPETILSFTARRPSTIPLPVMIVEASSAMRLATAEVFPAGTPRVKHSALTLFADIDRDRLDDIVFAEAGSDAPPWQGSRIGVALNRGGGTYVDVSSMIPQEVQTTRAYALAAGDVDSQPGIEVVLLDQNGSNHALLRWNGNGRRAAKLDCGLVVGISNAVEVVRVGYSDRRPSNGSTRVAARAGM
ncbi:MAG TPA: hypothetical protein VFB92_05255 [Vicinamibacterales bacterium]|nr:hypothetical protein [Vicinamibacterales bacterium]